MRVTVLLLLLLTPTPASAQQSDTVFRRLDGMVSGTVRDNIALRPLAGAIVQIVASDPSARYGRATPSDSQGRFVLDDVPDGRYTIGFFHPVLDSLGLEPPVREVLISGQRPVHADLATPTPAALRRVVCGARSSADSGALLVGIARDATDGLPASGAQVRAEWMEISLGRNGVSQRSPHLVATTADNGWFAMCNVPKVGTIFLMANRGAANTDLMEVRISDEVLVRHDLFLGPPRVTPASAGSELEAARVDPRVTGVSRMSGVVVDADGGRPLAGARVSIAQGASVYTNARGEWSVLNPPAGTRTLDVRAIGFYPEHARVDVVTNAAPLRVALSTMRAVLDTVNVRATSRYNRDRSGFDQRLRSGVGHYLTTDDIARRNPLVVSDLFRTVPGVRTQSDGKDTRFVMRGSFGDCAPVIFIDGLSLKQRQTADDLDTWIRVKDVKGVEIYSESTTPSQYQEAIFELRGFELKQIICGTILLWTK